MFHRLRGFSGVRLRLLVGAGREGQLLTSRRLWNSGYDSRRDWYGEGLELEVEEDGEKSPVGTDFREVEGSAWLLHPPFFWLPNARFTMPFRERRVL